MDKIDFKKRDRALYQPRQAGSSKWRCHRCPT